MYHYIIDQTRIPERRADKLLGEVYGHLAENQISGEVHRVTKLRTLEQLAEKAAEAGAKTIVVIGDDDSFGQAVDYLRDRSGVVLGFISLGPQSEIAEILGLGDLGDNCRYIAQRIVEEFGLGQANRSRFFTRAQFGPLYSLLSETGMGGLGAIKLAAKSRSIIPLPTRITVDSSYTAVADIAAGVFVNARPLISCGSEQALAASRADNHLQLLLLPPLSMREVVRYQGSLASGCLEAIPGCTILYGRQFEIESDQSFSLVSGGAEIAKAPAGLSVSPHRVRIIVGKER